MSNYQLDYTLSSKELYSALATARIVPKRGISQIIRTVLLLIVMVVVGINMSVDINYVKIGIVLEAVCIALLVLIWILPTIAFKSAVKTVGNKIDIRAEVQPGVITFDDGTTVKMGENGTIEDHPNDRMFIVSSVENKDQVYIIPYRTVDFEQFEDFRKTIMADPIKDNNIAEKSEQTEQDQEDDESFRLSQQMEEIINNSQALDQSEQEESIVDADEESIIEQSSFDEQHESIIDEADQQHESIVDEADQQPAQAMEFDDFDSGRDEMQSDEESIIEQSSADEQVDEQVDEQIDEQADVQIDESSAEAQAVNYDEVAEIEQEQDEPFKIDFSQVILQDVENTQDVLMNNYDVQAQPMSEMSEDVVESITQEMVEAKPQEQFEPEQDASQSIVFSSSNEMPLQEEDNEADVPELISSWNDQAAIMQMNDEAEPEVEQEAEPETEEIEEAEAAQADSDEAPVEENEAAEDDAADDEVAENEASENEVSDSHLIQKDDDQAENNNYEGIVLSDFEVKFTEENDTKSKHCHNDDIFDDSLRNLIDAYLN